MNFINCSSFQFGDNCPTCKTLKQQCRSLISNKLYLFSQTFKINILTTSSPRIKNYIIFQQHAATHYFTLLSESNNFKKQFFKIRCFLTIFFDKNLCMNHGKLFLSQQDEISPKEKNTTLVVTYFDIKVPSLMTSSDTVVNIL